MSDIQSSPLRMRAVGPMLLALLLTAFWLWADLASKDWAQAHLSEERPGAETEEVCAPHTRRYTRRQTAPYVLIDDFFELRYAENCGAAFSMFENVPLIAKRIVSTVAVSCVSLIMFWLLWRGYGGAWFYWAVPLIVSGAIGNFVDRIRFGYVIDFFHVYWQDWSYPIFNVADCTILVGVVFFFLDSFAKPSDSSALD